MGDSNPTKELRARLDELGIEHENYGYENHTWWEGSDGVGWHAENRPSVNGTYVKINAVLTPEQAIAATVGADEDEADSRDLMEAIRDDDGVRYSMDEVMDIMGKDVAAKVGVDSDTGEAIRKLLDKLNTELCNAGCIIDCETREERQRLIDAVKDKYAQAIAATAGNVGYGIQFADWCEFPPDTMAGETVFDSEGNAIGWIVDATVGKDIERYDGSGRRGTVAILQGGRKPEEVMFVGEDGGVTHYLPEGTCDGSFHKSSDISSGRVPLYYCKDTNRSIFVEREAKVCPLCGGRIKVVAE